MSCLNIRELARSKIQHPVQQSEVLPAGGIHRKLAVELSANLAGRNNAVAFAVIGAGFLQKMRLVHERCEQSA